jgi:hypothetical protein
MILIEMQLFSEGAMNGAGIQFIEFSESPTGDHIAEKVLDTIQYFHLWGRIIGIVVDNAAVNDVAICKISAKLNLNENSYPTEKELHLRCFGHIMNLGCKGKIKG